MDSGKKKMRVRKAPVRKWQRNEERTLIDFLKRNEKDFEKPTAQVYYKKFIDESSINDLEWKLVRAKVRNMRISYGKAKQWRDSPEALALNDMGQIRDVVTRMCSFFDDFEELFGSNTHDEVTFSFDGSMSSDYVKEEMLSDQASYTTEDVYTESEMTGFINEDSDEATAAVTHPTTTQPKSDGRHQTRFVEIGRLKKRKLDTNQSLREEELNLEREKLAFAKEKLMQEFDIKQREIDSQERLKILELEMKERIAMNEIKMKERVALKALEKKWE